MEETKVYIEEEQIKLMVECLVLFQKLSKEEQFYTLQRMCVQCNKKLDLSKMLEIGYNCATDKTKLKVLDLLEIDKRIIK